MVNIAIAFLFAPGSFLSLIHSNAEKTNPCFSDSVATYTNTVYYQVADIK